MSLVAGGGPCPKCGQTVPYDQYNRCETHHIPGYTEKWQEEIAAAAQTKDEPGKRFDSGKVRMDLLPFEALDGIAQVMTFGADKYGEHNWRKGMSWSRVIGPLMRHLSAWMRGEKNDPETGLPHLWHVGCNVLFLITYERTEVGEDDRWAAK